MEKHLPFGPDELRNIIKEHPTPFYIYDEAALKQRIRKLYKAFAWNSGFKEYYAVKACPNPALISIMRSEGCGIDCASDTELMIAEALGMGGSEIMFSSNVTSGEDYSYANTLRAIINLDDVRHIELLKQSGGIPKVICLRYNPGGDFTLGNTIMGLPGESKFGMTAAQIIDGIKTLRQYGAERFGLHAFLASNTTNAEYYPKLAGILFDLANRIYAETGVKIAFVNLSGGIGIPYKPEEDETDIMAVGEGVKNAYVKAFAKTGIAPDIYAELGRYITGPIGYLVSTVRHIKETYKKYIGLDACAANLMRPAIYGAYHHITILGKGGETELYDVTGSLCENNDKFATNRRLPATCPGDIAVIHDAGAHGFSMGYNYNGKLRSAELLYLGEGKTKLIRRAETAKEYFATLDFLNYPFMEQKRNNIQKEAYENIQPIQQDSARPASHSADRAD